MIQCEQTFFFGVEGDFMKDSYDKLKVLANAAKYDVSCSSSGVERKGKGKMGSARDFGICHSWSGDGRCISLLKILMTNKCSYNCLYCVNKSSSDVQRESFEPREIADITMEFYRRNYIEGLFLSSGVEKNPDFTMEKMAKALHILRNEYGFNGYIHAKILPGTSPEIISQIGFLTDRASVNMEVPSKESLSLLAPQKTLPAIIQPMDNIKNKIVENKSLQKFKSKPDRFVSAGMTTQMMIGASTENDFQILKTTDFLYQSFSMKRVYFSAYIPVVSDTNLPALSSPPQLKRENRLYQADWLLRFYQFEADELIDLSNPFLDLDFDPKFAWALRNYELFPMEINRVSFEELLRIPGIGVQSAYKILRARKHNALSYDNLKKMGIVLKRAKYFITCKGRYYGDGILTPDGIKNVLHPKETQSQIAMF